MLRLTLHHRTQQSMPHHPPRLLHSVGLGTNVGLEGKWFSRGDPSFATTVAARRVYTRFV